ncbi:MAG: C39 family peptidase [Candidatus Sericytochromatia bacterium]|nr:C39 family peptidase [Candidatus Tanganyikabacteria bacterium]
MASTATLVPKPKIGEVLVAGEFISPVDLERALAEQSATNERLGEILLRLGIVSEMELNAVLHYHHHDGETPDEHNAAVRHKLGDLLLRAKKVTKHQLESALAEQEKTNEKLGEVLLRLGLISADELSAVLDWQHEHSYNSAKAVRFMLGEILVASKVITRDQLKSALETQKLTKRQIGDILVEAGLAKPNHIAEALRIQGKLVAAALIGVIGSAALTGCGTGVSLSGIDVHEGAGIAKTTSGSYQYDNGHGKTFSWNGGGGGAGGAEHRTVASNAGGGMHTVSDHADGTRIIDNVPWFFQGAAVKGTRDVPDNTCAQAAMSMVLNYHQGQQAPTYQQVVDESNKFNMATTHTTVTNYLKAKGLQVDAYKNGTINHLKSAVDQGHPVIVMLQFDVPHYVTVIGYNDEQGEIIYHDSIDGPNQKLGEREFDRVWHNTDLKNTPIVGGANYSGLTIVAHM